MITLPRCRPAAAMSTSEAKRPVVHLSPTCSLVGKTTSIADPAAGDAGKGGVTPGSGRSRDVNVFLGVPYAQPPVGPLRFKDPAPFPLWKGERSATEFGKL